MNTIGNLLKNLHNVLRCIYKLLRYALTFIRAVLSPRAMLAARLLAAESQLAVHKQRILEKKGPRPRLTPCAFSNSAVVRCLLDKRKAPDWGFPDCARNGREGGRGILNAFELKSIAAQE